jgi:hypothetical protein
MSVIQKLSAAALALSLAFGAQAQRESISQDGEFGFGLGAAHYFGDLNTRLGLNRPKVSASIFFRKQFGSYVALRVQGTFAQLGYSDIYSENEFQKRRNLSFNSDVWELSLQGDFNFFKFIPGEDGYNFTPYVTIGAGIFSYNPYAILSGQQYFLKEYNTEGQGLPGRPAPYDLFAFSFPVGVGVKYALNERMNIAFEVSHRFTTTDYLDDVSSTYAGSAAFPALPNGDPSVGFLLQDRSYETGNGVPIGIAGRQRGNSSQLDQFVTAQVHLSWNITSYKCPTAY